MQMCINDVRGRGRLFEYNGKLYRSPKALAEEYGLPWNSLAHYIQRCKTIEEAVDRCKETQEEENHANGANDIRADMRLAIR